MDLGFTASGCFDSYDFGFYNYDFGFYNFGYMGLYDYWSSVGNMRKGIA